MFHWQFSSAQNRPKEWYIIALIIVLFFVVYGIIAQMYLMSIVVFLFAWVYIMMENNATPTTEVSINDHVIQVAGTTYNLDMIDRFTLLSNEWEYVMLRLFLKKWISVLIDIPLTSEVDSVWLKAFLSEFITYDTDASWTKSDRLIHTMRL
jgi:hypothetical protein